MLNTQNAGSLVSGGSASTQRVKIRLLKSKGIDGVQRDAGEEVEAKRDDAVYLVQRGYAEYVNQS